LFSQWQSSLDLAESGSTFQERARRRQPSVPEARQAVPDAA
jgi:hypothetical protein